MSKNNKKRSLIDHKGGDYKTFKYQKFKVGTLQLELHNQKKN